MDVRSNQSTSTAIKPLRWTPGTPESVKHALENLDAPHVLELSPLVDSPVISTRRSAAELRALLVDVVSELSDSRTRQDAEAVVCCSTITSRASALTSAQWRVSICRARPTSAG